MQQGEVHEGTWVAEALPFPESLEDVLAAWRLDSATAGHSPRTIDSRGYTVRRLARSLDPLDADRGQLVAWLASLTGGEGGLKRSSMATYRGQLRAFYQWLADTGRRSDDPSAQLPKPRTQPGTPRPLTPAQVVAVFRACDDPRAMTTRAYLTLACFAGLRVHEIAKVRGEDVQGDQLHVLGKGGRDAWLPMHPSIKLLATTMPPTGWWFPTASARGHVHRCSVSSAIKRAMTRAEVPGTPHATRHFYGTQVLRSSGGNLRMAQRALRHASPATTAIYTLIADDELAHAIAGIPAARGECA